MVSAKAGVMLVEDHPLTRLGLAHCVNAHPRLHSCGEADTETGALALLDTEAPDVAIVDINLRGGSGLDLIRRLRTARPSLRIIVSSMHPGGVYEARSLRAGADAYVCKDSGVEQLLDAVEVSLGQDPVAHRGRAEASAAMQEDFLVAELTDRELEVFRLFGEGCSTREIAAQLHRSVKTVESFRLKLKKKLGLETSTELTRDAARWVAEHRVA